MESVVRIVDVKKYVTVKNIVSCLFFFYASVLIFELSYVIFNSNELKNCFISIENFVTVRKIPNNTTCEKYDFDMKTYASSYSSPFLIELIQNSQKNCLCCPRD